MEGVKIRLNFNTLFNIINISNILCLVIFPVLFGSYSPCLGEVNYVGHSSVFGFRARIRWFVVVEVLCFVLSCLLCFYIICILKKLRKAIRHQMYLNYPVK